MAPPSVFMLRRLADILNLVKTLGDLEVSGKKVFLRADLDIPIEESDAKRLTTNAEIATRLTNIKKTVDYLLEHGAKQIVIAGHIDRPEKPDPSLSTRSILAKLKKILRTKISFKKNLENSDPVAENLLVLFENLRFWPEEVVNDAGFAQKLASMAHIYVNEAFGNCHRNHASMVALPALLPHAAGIHLQKELEELSKLLESPVRPFVAVVGGAKIETKLPLIKHLAKAADHVLIGGELVHEVRENAMKFADNVEVAVTSKNGKDIDEKSQNKFEEIIKAAKTVVWNGPMGVFEEGFLQGTMRVAKAIITGGAHSVVGGGETTQFLVEEELLSKFSFVSAGGGAMLEFLAGKELPGIKALE